MPHTLIAATPAEHRTDLLRRLLRVLRGQPNAPRVPAAALCRLTADPLRTNPFRRETRRCTMRFPMTTPELCELAGLTRPELQRWIDAGLLEADRDGRRREFGDDDRERARLIKALHTKGLPLSRLAREKSRI